MTGAKKILIVDDEPDMVVWLSTFFEDHDYETIFAYDGFEGFEKAKTDKPALITLDITMDKESGVKMFRNLQETEETADIPVIMITGVNPEFKKFIENRRQVKPPAGYFEKPVDRAALIAKVKELIG
ncbi:MAG: response regulator [Planctomycetota bacterium]|jgi:DNA-binding response OmpR family regulator